MNEEAQQVYTDLVALLKSGGPWAWLAILTVALILTFIAKFILGAVTSRLEKYSMHTKRHWDDLIVDCLRRIKSVFIFAWIAFPMVGLMAPHESVIIAAKTVVVVVTAFQIALWGMAAIRFWHENYLAPKIAEDASSAAVLGLMYLGVQCAFLVMLVLFAMSNMGINIGAVLAGLGVGGIAVALAAQNVLGDLLASLSIVLDKPFIVGDYIVVDSQSGTVEHIGVKTTRLRSLSGEQLVLSNKDILESRIQNFKSLRERRVVHQLGVTYSTPIEKLEKIPALVKEIFAKYTELRLDRVNFFRYGASSLDYEVVFFVANPDYNLYMDVQEKALLDIYRKFTAEKIEFAFPTQTIYVEKLPAAERSAAPVS